MRTPIAMIIIAAFSISSCKNQPTEPVVRGPQWVTFTLQNSQLLHNVVNAFTVDLAGRVWAGTDSGASGFLRGSWSSIVDSLAYSVSGSGGTTVGHTVLSIGVGKDGSLWFGM